MAKVYRVPINLQQLELQNARVQNLGADPGTPVTGQIYYNTGNNTLRFYNGTSFVTLSTGSVANATTGAVGVIQLAGDLGGSGTTATAPVISAGAITAVKMDRTVLVWHQPARVAATSNITISGPGAAIDGVTLSTGDRVLLTAQGTGSQNGIWVFNGSAAALTRPTDFTGTAGPGALVYVTSEGTTTPNTLWKTTTAGSITVDTTSTAWTQHSALTTGTAGGDLTGTYPNPTVAAGAIGTTKLADASVTGGTAGSGVKLAANTITAANIANATITDVQVAAANKDGVAGTASMRTLGTGSTQALAGNTRLDQVTAPTASVSLNSQKIVSLADPTLAQDAATKNYVDNSVSGLSAKTAALVATTGSENFTIAAGAVTQITGTTVDGQSPAINDRILIKDAPVSTGTGSANSNQPGNGIYVVTNATTNLTVSRASDMDLWSEIPSAYVWVEKGTVNADTGWVITSDPGGTINTTAIQWSQFTASTTIQAGSGLTKTGQTLSVNVDNTTIAITGNNLNIKSTYVGQTSITTLGTITTGTWTGTSIAVLNGGTGSTTATGARTNLGATGIYTTATHGAGTTITITQGTHGLAASQALHVSLVEVATGDEVIADVNISSGGTVTITFAASQSANTHRVTIIG